MPIEQQPDPETEAHPSSISLHASDWLRQFVKHFEQNFVDASEHLAPNANLSAYQLATVRAVIATLNDSGLTAESAREMLAQVSMEQDNNLIEWTSDLNNRRFELIDKDIQETLPPMEQIELTALTKIMRQHLDAELTLPMEGARALHRKLTELPATDQSR